MAVPMDGKRKVSYSSGRCGKLIIVRFRTDLVDLDGDLVGVEYDTVRIGLFYMCLTVDI